jgi:hypothetical protein
MRERFGLAAMCLALNVGCVGASRPHVIVGSTDKQTKACEESARTRSSGKTKHSYGNCVPEAWRHVINHKRASEGLPLISEEELLKDGIEGEYLVNHPGQYNHGASSPPEIVKLLASDKYGIVADVKKQTIDDIVAAVLTNRAVSISIHPYHFGSYVDDGWFHEVAVSGIAFDPDGQLDGIVINDSGLGACGLVLSMDDYNKDYYDGALMTVSRDPQW